MLTELKKTEDGILARHDTAKSWFRIPDKIRTAHDERVKIAMWINPEAKKLFLVLDRIVTELMCDKWRIDNRETHVSWGRDDEDAIAESILVIYDQPAIMHINDIAERPNIFLLGRDGYPLCGSNVFGSGDLCLGEYINPLSPQCVELLMANAPNLDLGWMGGDLYGKWDQDYRDGYPVFRVEDWPILTSCTQFTIPQPILENFDAWSQR